MQILANTILTIGLQLTLGALTCAAAMALLPAGTGGTDRIRRRRIAVRARAAARMMRSLPFAVGLALTGAALRVALGADPRDLLPGAGLPVFLVVGVIPTSGAYLLHDAARLEAAGRLRVARRQVRLGGRFLCGGVLLLLLGTAVDVLLRPGSLGALFDGSPRTILLLAGSVLALTSAAFVALLAGLSRKPRPSGGIAVLLYLCGLAGLLGTAGLF